MPDVGTARDHIREIIVEYIGGQHAQRVADGLLLGYYGETCGALADRMRQADELLVNGYECRCFFLPEGHDPCLRCRIHAFLAGS